MVYPTEEKRNPTDGLQAGIMKSKANKNATQVSEQSSGGKHLATRSAHLLERSDMKSWIDRPVMNRRRRMRRKRILGRIVAFWRAGYQIESENRFLKPLPKGRGGKSRTAPSTSRRNRRSHLPPHFSSPAPIPPTYLHLFSSLSPSSSPYPTRRQEDSVQPIT
jgi:hypothetical protein